MRLIIKYLGRVSFIGLIRVGNSNNSTELLQRRSRHCEPHPELTWCPAPQGASVWLSQGFVPPGAELKVQLSLREQCWRAVYLPSRPNRYSTSIPGTERTLKSELSQPPTRLEGGVTIVLIGGSWA